MNFQNEHDWSRAKVRWQARHRWAPRPAEVWLSLVGEIDEASVGGVIRALAQAPDTPAFLQIDSGGGNLAAAWDGYAALRAHPAPVTCAAGARCHSGALVILLGGDERLAAKSSKFLLHGCAGAPAGRPSAATLWAAAQEVAEADRDMVSLICFRTGRSARWKVIADMQNETVLDAEAALLRGIVSRLTD